MVQILDIVDQLALGLILVRIHRRTELERP